MAITFNISEIKKCECPNWIIGMIGVKFGQLIPKSFVGIRNNRHYIKCLCAACNKLHVVGASNVKGGTTKSCGCDKGPSIRRMKTVHGGSHDGPLKVEYRTWRSMRERCLKKDHQAYHNYGGRGITVCDRWAYTRGGFENFYNDMGKRPKGKFSIERIDNMKGYYKENCIWILKKRQPRNRRTTWKVIYEGRIIPASDASLLLGYPNRHAVANWLSKNYKSKARAINIEKFLQWGNRRGPKKNKIS